MTTEPRPLQWHAYFSAHGDPSVVTDPNRPAFTEICKVSTSPADYGRANCELIARAPELQAENARLRQALQSILATSEPSGAYMHYRVKASEHERLLRMVEES